MRPVPAARVPVAVPADRDVVVRVRPLVHEQRHSRVGSRLVGHRRPTAVAVRADRRVAERGVANRRVLLKLHAPEISVHKVPNRACRVDPGAPKRVGHAYLAKQPK